MSAIVYLRSSTNLAEVDDGSIPLILTGPPYWPPSLENALREVPESRTGRRHIAEQLGQFAESLRGVFKECARALAPGCACILQTRDIRLGDTLVPVAAIHRDILQSLGLVLYTRYWWIKAPQEPDRVFEADQAGRFGRPRPVDPEEFLVFLKPGKRLARVEPASEDLSVLAMPLIQTPMGSLPEPHRHMAPLPLCRLLVRAWSKPGDLVLDPFAGHGTMLVAAQTEGRSPIGYEIHPTAYSCARRNLGLEA